MKQKKITSYLPSSPISDPKEDSLPLKEIQIQDYHFMRVQTP